MATRVRITFAKTEAMRYTSHLDLARTWERTLRRAGLPMTFSKGYNPRPRLVLATALPLGFTSQCEMVDIWLAEERPLSQIETAINASLPPGIEALNYESIDPDAPKTPTLVEATTFTATLLDLVPDLDTRIGLLLERPTIHRERRGKPYDLRPLIEELTSLEPGPSGEQRLHMRLSARGGATGRPDEVLFALEIDPHSVRIHRTRLIFRNLEL
jgi:radical SAM-linked protein